VEITAALTADFAILSEALDETRPDISESLRQFVADVRLAVRSYLGLTVMSGSATFPLTLTVMEDSAHPDDVASSLMMPLSDEHANGTGLALAVVLYAARSGAFVDLTADLGWMTGCPLSDFALDQHLSVHAKTHSDRGVQAASLVNQAIGVLLGHGYTPEQAEQEIDARAAAAGHSRSDAATIVLAGPAGDDKDPTRDPR
jgi:predicted RNase H-related nuclease YkuK (DUF458 family)